MKYEFTGETKSYNGITLKQIRAIADIKKFGVKAGDIGGWIEKEENLDQEGDAWVSGNARVYGDASVSGDARVSGNAWVYGNAWEKSPLYIQGTKYAFYFATKKKIGIGCQVFSFSGWHNCWRKIAAKFDLTEAEQKEYIAYFNLACDLYGEEKHKVNYESDDGNGEIEEV